MNRILSDIVSILSKFMNFWVVKCMEIMAWPMKIQNVETVVSKCFYDIYDST